MPLFAFGNAGISLAGPSQHRDVTMGGALGLTIGKPAGIMAATAAALATGRATMPTGVTMATLHGCARLGGVGLTMSLFIAGLAFGGSRQLEAAQTGIVIGSLIAGIVAIVLKRALPAEGDRVEG